MHEEYCEEDVEFEIQEQLLAAREHERELDEFEAPLPVIAA